MSEPCKIAEPFGPSYPDLGASVAKYRRKNSNADLKAYGNAVLEAIRSKQAAELRRELKSIPKPNCASGTYLSEGRDILEAMRKKQNAALLSCPAQIRRGRTRDEWWKLYNEAMIEKRYPEYQIAA